MSNETKFTPGMKAAKCLCGAEHLAPWLQMDRVAAIIDEETAAPEMYAALEMIRLSLYALVPDPKKPNFMPALGNSNEGDNRELLSCLETANDALRKARGE